MRRIVLFTAAIAAAVSLTACGSSITTNHSANSTMPMPAATTAGDHNGADVMFAQMMVPHHQSAIEMANMAPTRAGSAQVKSLAARIASAQGPEITEMNGWMTTWNQPAGDMAMTHSMPGAMSESDMSQLMASSGAAFDRQFLTMMISHHQGAIEMARTEQSGGQYGPAKTLAGNIIASQSGEVTEMQGLLKTV